MTMAEFRIQVVDRLSRLEEAVRNHLEDDRRSKKHIFAILLVLLTAMVGLIIK